MDAETTLIIPLQTLIATDVLPFITRLLTVFAAVLIGLITIQ